MGTLADGTKCVYCGVNPASYIPDDSLGQICLYAPGDDSDAEIGEGTSCHDDMVKHGEKFVNDRRLQKLMRLIKLRRAADGAPLPPEIVLRIAKFIFNHDGDDRWRQERTAAGPMPAAAESLLEADNMVDDLRLPANPAGPMPVPTAADNMMYDRRLAAREDDDRRWIIQWLAASHGRREWIAQLLATHHDVAAADTSLTMPRATDNMAPAADNAIVSLTFVGDVRSTRERGTEFNAVNMPRDIRLSQQNPPRTSGRTDGEVDHHRRYTTETETQ